MRQTSLPSEPEVLTRLHPADKAELHQYIENYMKHFLSTYAHTRMMPTMKDIANVVEGAIKQHELEKHLVEEYVDEDDMLERYKECKETTN